MNKKTIIFSIFILISLVLGTTFAYYASKVASGSNSISELSGYFDISFINGTNAITGEIGESNNYTEGVSTTVSIKKNSAASLNANVTLKIKINSISQYFTTGALKWIVYQGNTLIKSGDFVGVTTNSVIDITNGIDLIDTTTYTYTVYVWLDAALTNNNMINQSIGAKIFAEGYLIN